MAKILVVDDVLPIRSMMRQMLLPGGHEVIDAVNGQEAQYKIEKYQPDLVLTDLVMPICDGFELLSVLSKRWPQLPVIAMSGGGSQIAARDCLRIASYINCTNTLLKPFTTAQLNAAIESALWSIRTQPDTSDEASAPCPPEDSSEDTRPRRENDRRGGARHLMSMPVSLQTEHGLLVLACRNLGFGGMRVTAPQIQNVTVGGLLWLSIEIDHTEDVMMASAEVKWVESPDFGFKFEPALTHVQLAALFQYKWKNIAAEAA